MIKSVRLTRFKRFTDSTFELHPHGISFLAGANNSGKSTLLQAIAVWEFCRFLLAMEKGMPSLLPNFHGQGLGLSDDEFSPIAVASLKHLWTNLKSQNPGGDGYSLAVECRWLDAAGAEKRLKLALALTNDRLFIKTADTNLAATDILPTVAYLPPFAGIVSRENQMSGAERRAMIGRGLAGGVIRNLIHDMFQVNEQERAKLKEGRTKIKNSDLDRLRREDPWEVLQATMARLFGMQLDVEPFNQLYHAYIRVKCIKGTWDGKKFKRYPNFQPRDLMAEGSGFLQWLSVYTLALSPTVKTLLLDEPDAHLHPSLQAQLVEALEEIVAVTGKQVLMATHSTEILRWADHTKVLEFKGAGARYLQKDDQKINLFIGLGSDYAPKIDPLRKSKCMLIVENNSDARLLKAWADTLGIEWPKGLVIWPWTGGSTERKQLFLQLKAEVPDLKALSLRDRDDLELEQVDKATLRDKSVSNHEENLHLRVWRRRHIENYLLLPTAIARASDRPVGEVTDLFAEHALVAPANFASRDVADAMLDARGKEITQTDDRSIKRVLDVTPIAIAKAMLPEEIAEDAAGLIRELVNMCAAPQVAEAA
ncbi:ATP-binding protein [Mesorhizobium sp. CA14]|uniref:ATP-dependent nuclease n=1 Tax=Mesorhizobium sp. CA14 TaxID=2876642 RepID=UPI001CCE472F|nr:ATP-binding protein [Mesorhizobium sp. CA14]MBZ9850282.1 ATP-binding protein [Mesorhizobium sp. CA14]